MKKKTTGFRFSSGGRSFGMRRVGRRGVAEPPGGRSPPAQAQPADFAEGERRLRRRCGKQGTDNKERGYVSGAAGQVARIEGDSCGGGNCLNLTFCVLAKEDSPATREQGPNSDVEDALNMGWEETSPRRRGILLGAGVRFCSFGAFARGDSPEEKRRRPRR